MIDVNFERKVSKNMEMWFEVILLVAKRSHCSRSSVGCLLLDGRAESLIAFGYNGNVRKGPNNCDRTDVGNCGCIHAEANALVKPRSQNPKIAIVSLTPCIMCAKLLVQAGIREVWAIEPYRAQDETVQLFQNHHIQLAIGVPNEF